MARAHNQPRMKATDQQVRLAYEELRSIYKVADRFGMAKSSVFSRIKRLNIPFAKSSRFSESENDLLRSRYDDAIKEHQLPELAVEMGRSLNSIRVHAQILGLGRVGRKRPWATVVGKMDASVANAIIQDFIASGLTFTRFCINNHLNSETLSSALSALGAVCWKEVMAQQRSEYHKKSRRPDWYERRIERSRLRRARKRGAEGSYSRGDIRWLFDKQRGKCAHSWCRKTIREKYHIDHVIPLILGGANDKKNIQLLCPPCNWRKHTTHPIVFAQRHGMLL